MNHRSNMAWLSLARERNLGIGSRHLDDSEIEKLRMGITDEADFIKDKDELKRLNEINIDDYLEKLKQDGIEFADDEDCHFPKMLKNYYDPVKYLYYRGELPKGEKLLAVVGARACSRYGQRMTEEICRASAGFGISIVSGLARGIDTAAAVGALRGIKEGGSGRVYAVLGCGIDICYPYENRKIYDEIINNGAIISEYPPKSEPFAWHFPKRNRIISGISDKVFVAQAREKSGSLITADWALEQGKDVLALPGNVDDKLSEGTNRLIRSGAIAITKKEDIFEEFYGVDFEESKENLLLIEEKILEKDLSLLYSWLRLQPLSVNELVEMTGLDYGKITSDLLKLQLEGLAERLPDGRYCKLKN